MYVQCTCTPPGWDASPSQGYPGISFAGMYFYKSWWRKALCELQRHCESCSISVDREVSALNMKAPCSYVHVKSSVYAKIPIYKDSRFILKLHTVSSHI